MQRQPMDLETYSEQALTGPCFICRMLAGDPDYAHEIVYEDEHHVAFLDRWPVLPGKLLVCPKQHLEHAVADFTEPAYLRMMQAVRLVALAAEDVVPGERTYLFSMGSQAGNAHLHWHVARIPEGVPYAEQQFESMKFEKGIVVMSPSECADLADRLRAAIAARTGLN
ncbi:HIT family protein [Streptacidiphilus carbonis]|jgi:histidine triad (HIT) family protein|uniref:HIT family protein n=1 Tax=Streptacidiphilus carbonis TaxID=105422 RepID=UPI000B05443C|nr:HIT family protein [Streptacidiphilus carbonis]